MKKVVLLISKDSFELLSGLTPNFSQRMIEGKIDVSELIKYCKAFDSLCEDDDSVYYSLGLIFYDLKNQVKSKCDSKKIKFKIFD
ncbi:hypothetical protein [uncultured Lactobacillus sp.]|uniref:hypothetical protein n=1 Tax=uncultured Lactobacillus sp. TaxID=153152 RepID=UPI0026111C0D|nr:hypothetical protein [uncultured Lactobacillus sp.]